MARRKSASRFGFGWLRLCRAPAPWNSRKVPQLEKMTSFIDEMSRRETVGKRSGTGRNGVEFSVASDSTPLGKSPHFLQEHDMENSN